MKAKIPSSEEFARASKHMEVRFRNLDNVCENVLHQYRSRCALHELWILPQRDVDFRVYVFFEKNKDIEVCQRNGIEQEIINAVYSELEAAGRGKQADLTVAFEFDSDENATMNFDGDYFLRLR